MKAKLTKRFVDALKSEGKDVIVWDTELKGFGCKVTPRGRKSYFLYYRMPGGRERRPKIGDHGPLTADGARAIAQKWLRQVADDVDPSAVRQTERLGETLAEFAKRYITEFEAGKKKPSTLETDRINLRCHIKPALGRLKVADIDRADVLRLYHSMRKTPGAANRTLALISHMLNVAEKWGLRPDGSNPCRHVEKYPECKRERFLSRDELAALGDALSKAERTRTEKPGAIAAIRLLILTGCRLSEILTLKWDEVDFEGQCLRLGDSKTGKKTVYLPAPALAVLEGIDRQEGRPWVIVGRKPGAHLVNLRKAWGRIRKAAKLKDVRLHDLRHTYASFGAGADLSLPMIGRLLGHTQHKTTQRYAHLHDDPVKRAAEKVGAIIGSALNGKTKDAKVQKINTRHR